MDQVRNLLVETYNLFLISGLIKEDSGISRHIVDQIESEQYEKAMRYLIYVLLGEINHRYIYIGIKQELIENIVNMLSILEAFGFKTQKVIDDFKDVLIRFYKYALENSLDLKRDKERTELIMNKLKKIELL